ncbi:hypothetical protein M9Y10_010513 [Tritrichomonas musculus]|uniref:Uncharacterized protein n=1 Tax=Tritrichomonas musculus TaxID=1915356 RepID=A0ABR2IKZ0_9EUKA
MQNRFYERIEFFVNAVSDEEMQNGITLEQMRMKMEEYFGVHLTDCKVAKFKNFNQYFYSKRMTRNGWRGINLFWQVKDILRYII